jgi:hypothetical protein
MSQTTQTENETMLRMQADLLEHSLVKPRCRGITFYLSTDMDDQPQWVAKFVSRGTAVDWIGLGKTPQEALKSLWADVEENGVF